LAYLIVSICFVHSHTAIIAAGLNEQEQALYGDKSIKKYKFNELPLSKSFAV
jgi:hypothetical protein